MGIDPSDVHIIGIYVEIIPMQVEMTRNCMEMNRNISRTGMPRKTRSANLLC